MSSIPSMASNICVLSTAESVLQWMKKGCTTKIQPGLIRMEWILKRLNHPHRRCKFIHIAGTNGKGSTAAMIDSVLRVAGYTTGLFVSPYIVHWSERIQYNGSYISERSFVRCANQLIPIAEEMVNHGLGRLSPFEFWTLLAIVYYSGEVHPDFIIWETGLGGEWDATNVVHPLVSVITQLGLDHQEWLGNAITDIARAKAGIIKSAVPVVTGNLPSDALQIIEARAKLSNSQLFKLHQHFSYTSIPPKASQKMNYSNMYREITDLTIPLHGKHQLENSAVAITTLEILRQKYAIIITNEHIHKGLSSTYWPGRFEIVHKAPLTVLDGAHNLDGVHTLLQTVEDLFPNKRLHLIFGMLRTKGEPLQHISLFTKASSIITTKVKGLFPSYSHTELAELIKTACPNIFVNAIDNIEDAIPICYSLAESEDIIVITGSLYLVAEARQLLQRKEKLVKDR